MGERDEVEGRKKIPKLSTKGGTQSEDFSKLRDLGMTGSGVVCCRKRDNSST